MINRNPKILIVDNYDSFTFNLVEIFKEYGHCSYTVLKNDQIVPGEVNFFDAFLFSPGPGIPSEAPVMADLLRLYHREKSFLGICLGHQAIAEEFGAKLVNLHNVRHGLKVKVRVTCPDDYLFTGISGEFDAGLYHSWTVEDGNDVSMINPQLRVTARSSDNLIMSIAHISCDVKGVQFHPESFMTDHGRLIIHNWINHIKVKG